LTAKELNYIILLIMINEVITMPMPKEIGKYTYLKRGYFEFIYFSGFACGFEKSL